MDGIKIKKQNGSDPPLPIITILVRQKLHAYKDDIDNSVLLMVLPNKHSFWSILLAFDY